MGGTRPPDRLPLITPRADPPSRRSGPGGRWVIAGGDRTGAPYRAWSWGARRGLTLGTLGLFQGVPGTGSNRETQAGGGRDQEKAAFRIYKINKRAGSGNGP